MEVIPISKCQDVCVRELKTNPFSRTPLVIKHTQNEGSFSQFICLLHGNIKLESMDVMHYPTALIALIHLYTDCPSITSLLHIIT